MAMNLYDAIILAATSHYGQIDYSDQPYILHLLRVMMQMPTDELRMAAILHDVVEDTPCTLDDLRRRGCPENVVAAVDALTLRTASGESFAGHLERVKNNSMAARVKLADIEDNLHASRILARHQHDLVVVREYARAYRELRSLLDRDAVFHSTAVASPSSAGADVAFIASAPSARVNGSSVAPAMSADVDAAVSLAMPSLGEDAAFVVMQSAGTAVVNGVELKTNSDRSEERRIEGTMSLADLLYPVARDRRVPPADSTTLPAWANVRFLFEARLAPLASQVLPAYPYIWCDTLVSELAPWSDRVVTVQEALRMATIDIITACDDFRMEIIPLKGIDALLWGGGRFGTVHTRDVDLLISPGARPIVEAKLVDMGYAQIDMLDCEAGRARTVPAEKKRSAESGRYEYWPWTRYVAMQSLDADVDCTRLGAKRAHDPELTLRDVTWPLSVVNGHVVIGIEVDLHHSVWPAIPYDQLELGYCTYGLHTFRRMMIADQLVTTATKIVAELIKGKRSALGAVAQVLQLIRTYGSPDLTVQCSRRAAELGLEREWTSAVALLTAMLGWRVVDDPRFPLISDPDMVNEARTIVMNSFIATLCTDM